jgi:Sugar phosphate isomerases/epimerases
MSLAFGVCLFSVYTELQKDYLRTIEKVAEVGYKNVELLASNFDTNIRYIDTIPLKVIKNKYEELQLNIISTHEKLPSGSNILDQDWDSVIKYNYELGCMRIVIPAVWIKGREDTLSTAEQFNVLGKKCRENGIQLYLHTHSHEFKRVGNETLYDILVENTDPQYLKFQVDMAWTMRAGIDPVSVLEKLGSRCDMVHQKDISKKTNPVNLFEVINEEDEKLDVLKVYQKYVKPGDFVDLGEGIFNFATVYRRIKEMGYVKYAFAENESINIDRFKSIENDFNIMKKYI